MSVLDNIIENTYASPDVLDDVEEQKELLRERLAPSITLFGRTILDTLFYLPPAQFHFELDKACMDDSIRLLNIIAPRRHAKSAFISNAFPLHRLLNSIRKGRREFILIISKSGDTAEELLNTIKYQLEHNESLIELYGDYGENTAKVWQNRKVVLKDDTVLWARGIGQPVMGFRHLNLRPTLIIIDDPQDKENTKTAEAMRHHLKWVLGEVIPALDKERGRCIVVGTPKHELCLVWCFKNSKKWRTLDYDSLIDEDLPTQRMLWPEGFPYEELMEMKEVNEEQGELALYYSEYRCQMLGAEEQIFKPEYMQFYKGRIEETSSGYKTMVITHRHTEKWNTHDKEIDDSFKLANVERLSVITFSGVDPASSLSAGADWSTIVTVAVDKDDNIYILPYFRKHVSPMKLCRAMQDHYELYDAEKMEVETVGYQEMLRDYFRDKDDINIPGLHRKNSPRDRKSARLESMEYRFFNKKVHIMPNMVEFMNEAYLYPRGKHDDLLDGLYYALKRIWRPSHGLDPMVDLTGSSIIREINDDDEAWLLV